LDDCPADNLNLWKTSGRPDSPTRPLSHHSIVPRYLCIAAAQITFARMLRPGSIAGRDTDSLADPKRLIRAGTTPAAQGA